MDFSIKKLAGDTEHMEKSSKQMNTALNTRKSVIILQPHGLGDIIFCQGIASHYRNGGYKVYWPVIEEYIHDLRRHYPDIIWLPENLYVSERLFEVEKVKYDLLHAICAPIRWSNTFQKVEYWEVMKAKYDMYGLDWTKWNESSKWIRDMFKEDELMGFTGAESGTPYNLISEFWGSSANALNRAPVEPDNELKSIHIKKLEGYSLFDWAKVMENAEQIHFVSSSNIYMLETLNLKAKEIHIYTRGADKNGHKNYSYLLRKYSDRYILH
jgi:hypothetical protein